MRNAGERTWVRLGLGWVRVRGRVWGGVGVGVGLGLGVGIRVGVGVGVGVRVGVGVGVGGVAGVGSEDLDGDVADDASDDGGGGVAEGGHLVGEWVGGFGVGLGRRRCKRWQPGQVGGHG